MSFLAWAVLGIIAGFIASKVINKTGEGLVIDLVLGVVGAFVGGWIMAQFGEAASGSNLTLGTHQLSATQLIRFGIGGIRMSDWYH